MYFLSKTYSLLFSCSKGYLDGRSASIDTVTKEQKAYLFRTNFNLFNCAVQLIIDKGLKNVGFVGVRNHCFLLRKLYVNFCLYIK